MGFFAVCTSSVNQHPSSWSDRPHHFSIFVRIVSIIVIGHVQGSSTTTKQLAVSSLRFGPERITFIRRSHSSEHHIYQNITFIRRSHLSEHHIYQNITSEDHIYQKIAFIRTSHLSEHHIYQNIAFIRTSHLFRCSGGTVVLSLQTTVFTYRHLTVYRLM
jgi:hypothetical protein